MRNVCVGRKLRIYKTSQNNELVEDRGVGFDHSTPSFQPEVLVDTLLYVFFLEKFC